MLDTLYDVLSILFTSADSMTTRTQVDRKPRRLVICLDGTGNSFRAKESDTNVVKIYQMLNRNTGEQFHYYQPGIGTFSTQQSNRGLFATMREKISFMFDKALGTTFQFHVCAGYEFLMKYYSPGDDIYIFGFSRGAYTARFLAEMIHEVGLLSRGNEEMVHFAFTAFSKVLNARGAEKMSPADVENDRYLQSFKRTFCRPSVTVHFLGLFDCVNSVGQFEIPFRRSSYRYIAKPPAKHIRHAVSIHERRLKFKPALFVLNGEEQRCNDIKEVWFAGNHCDVGGGYEYQGSTRHLISDIPLAWMIDEILDLEDHPAGPLDFDRDCIDGLGHVHMGREWSLPKLDDPDAAAQRVAAGREVKLHDSLKFGRGASWYAPPMWWLLEILPLFTRLELERGEWVPRYWPPNLGVQRDITNAAVIHPSVGHLHRAGIVPKLPQVGGDAPPMLKDPLVVPRMLLKALCFWQS